MQLTSCRVLFSDGNMGMSDSELAKCATSPLFVGRHRGYINLASYVEFIKAQEA